jgi:hypothetical protein
MTTETRQRVAVSMKALMARINRKLAHEDEMLKATRGERYRHDLGDYYVIGIRVGGVNASHVDPEELGREIGVLKPWEVAR